MLFMSVYIYSETWEVIENKETLLFEHENIEKLSQEKRKQFIKDKIKSLNEKMFFFSQKNSLQF